MSLSEIYSQDIQFLLQKLAEELDIPDYLYEDATLKYEDVGEQLAANDSELKEYSPKVYPQGSFRIGTVVRPIITEDEYDIDLVCHLQIEKERITQKQLKEMVGERLKKRADFENILSSSRRCWILSFPKQFHMDILPAIPNRANLPTGILLTDTELKLWQCSNPIEYAEWFKNRMKTVFQERRAVLAKSLDADIEEVPDWKVRTPLQRIVQLLKRHRDIYFQDKENKPQSIIITTLVAMGYENQSNIFDALTTVVRKMPLFIENKNGKWWIPNPVDPNENFAEKWNEKIERKDSFLNWLKKVQNDFTFTEKIDIRKSIDQLAPALGPQILEKAASSIGIQRSTSIPVISHTAKTVPTLADSSHCKEPKWPINLRYDASIRGSVHYKLYLEKKLWDITNRPLPKNVGLKFIVKTNTPFPYDVHWQVVNTGRVAAAVQGGLRGDFYANNDRNNVRWERTEYTGTHWIEAFIVKDGACVARSGKKYVIIRE